MACNPRNFGLFDTCSSSNCRSIFARLNALDDNHGANDRGDDRDRTLWEQARNLVWHKRDAKCRDQQHIDDILNPHGGRRISIRNHIWRSRHHRNRGYHSDNRYNFYYYILIGLLQIISFASPVKAQTSDGTTVIANPQASSTGSVTNSAVQINQGSYSTQGLGTGHYCNSGTMVSTPFYLGAGFHPEYSRSENYGAQISFAIPLDGSAQEICKELGRKKIQQKRVDILLTRIRECTAMYEKGYMIRPNSPYSAICDDVVPIAAYSNLPASSQASSEPD